MHKKIASAAFEIASVIVGALVVVALIFTFCFKMSTVSGQSMEPTLKNGEKLLIACASADYDYRDIVIVVEPNDLNEPLVKRVIATPGQWIDVRYDEGLVYVGDSPDDMHALDEPYTASLTDRVPAEDRHDYPVQVPEGNYFVMGDNRNHSTDSRSYRVDFIDENYILGKALIRLAPVGNFLLYD